MRCDGVSEITVLPGWPDANSENAAVKAGVVDITVFPASGVVRNTTRYIADDWSELSRATQTLTASVSGFTVTFAGTGANGQIAGIQVGQQAYSVAAPLALADVATALAAVIPGASSTGSVITVTGPLTPVAGVGAPITICQRGTRPPKQLIRRSGKRFHSRSRFVWRIDCTPWLGGNGSCGNVPELLW